MDDNKQTTDDQTPPLKQLESPVSLPQKEYEGIPSRVDNSELVTRSETEPELHPEVAEAGVETVSEKPGLSPDHFKAGIKHAPQITPVKTQPSGIVQLPMTKQQAQNIVKTNKKITDSIYWLAALVLKQIKKINIRINPN